MDQASSLSQPDPQEPFNQELSAKRNELEFRLIIRHKDNDIRALKAQVSRLTRSILLRQQQHQVSTLFQVDPGIEASIRAMSKEIEEKNTQILRLKMLTDASQQQPEKIAHKMQALMEENRRLGLMLSSGRAQQAKMESDVLAYENKLLQNRLDEAHRLIADYQARDKSSALKENRK